MMRRVIGDINQILMCICMSVGRLQPKQINRITRRSEKSHYLSKKKFLSQSIIIPIGKISPVQ
jgi:hypothetical protein